ncbi:MAG: BspA family leucine-rich repeat surface protein [Ekhidna sp.]|nr:BspA family leucine-rich repeat surface protein [Ekhidna sp.]
MKNIFLTLLTALFAGFVQAQDDPNPFITTWETTEDNEAIVIPTFIKRLTEIEKKMNENYENVYGKPKKKTNSNEETYSYTVDWGDGSTDSTTYTGDAVHTYTKAGTYTVTFSGTFPRIYFNYGWNQKPNIDSSEQIMSKAIAIAAKIRTIKQWGDNRWTSMGGAFAFCENLTIADEAGVPNLSDVTDMSGMFSSSSFTGDLSKWDVSSVTNMAGMFQSSSFSGDLSKWDVSSVTNMAGMFQNFSLGRFLGDENLSDKNPFTGDISKWDVSNVTNMNGMFSRSSFNGDISKWDVSGVTDMSYMFNKSSFTGDINKWDISNVTDMRSMFNKSSFNGDLSKWDISNVKKMKNMFKNSSMSAENYDALLIGWSTLDEGETQIPKKINFDPPARYSCAGAAAREKLTGTYRWRIKGDKLVEKNCK